MYSSTRLSPSHQPYMNRTRAYLQALSPSSSMCSSTDLLSASEKLDLTSTVTRTAWGPGEHRVTPCRRTSLVSCDGAAVVDQSGQFTTVTFLSVTRLCSLTHSVSLVWVLNSWNMRFTVC